MQPSLHQRKGKSIASPFSWLHRYIGSDSYSYTRVPRLPSPGYTAAFSLTPPVTQEFRVSLLLATPLHWLWLLQLHKSMAYGTREIMPSEFHISVRCCDEHYVSLDESHCKIYMQRVHAINQSEGSMQYCTHGRQDNLLPWVMNEASKKNAGNWVLPCDQWMRPVDVQEIVFLVQYTAYFAVAASSWK